ncbi:MAG: family 20 glycosylhydrolase, partial [Bacteroidales bacterium]|nr:family 20 glycosylhydrolase [Bacteroidales bacterium]
DNLAVCSERIEFPSCRIEDTPRFSYRGKHFDSARHFFTIEQVKKHIDLMAYHKLNTLHFHLTDDQGWRVEIKRYPKLQSVASKEKERLSDIITTMTKETRTMTAFHMADTTLRKN